MYFHFFSLSLLRIEKDYDMKIRVLYVLLAAWGMMSCVSVQTIGFDQLCPAEVSLPEGVRSVAVVCVRRYGNPFVIERRNW